MATGKTNSQYVRVLIDDNTPTPQDISESVTGVTGVGLEYEETDVTAYSDGVKNFALGHPSSEIEITGPFDNTALTGSHQVFGAIVGNQTTPHRVIVDVGIRAAPTTGDPRFEGRYYCSRYAIGGDGNYTARLIPAAPEGLLLLETGDRLLLEEQGALRLETDVPRWTTV